MVESHRPNVSRRSQTQQNSYCVIPSIQSSRRGKTNLSSGGEDRSYLSVCEWRWDGLQYILMWVIHIGKNPSNGILYFVYIMPQ